MRVEIWASAAPRGLSLRVGAEAWGRLIVLFCLPLDGGSLYAALFLIAR